MYSLDMSHLTTVWGAVSSVRARGNVKRRLGNYKDALRDLNRADCLSPHSSWILGYVVKALGISFVNVMGANQFCAQCH